MSVPAAAVVRRRAGRRRLRLVGRAPRRRQAAAPGRRPTASPTRRRRRPRPAAAGSSRPRRRKRWRAGTISSRTGCAVALGERHHFGEQPAFVRPWARCGRAVPSSASMRRTVITTTSRSPAARSAAATWSNASRVAHGHQHAAGAHLHVIEGDVACGSHVKRVRRLVFRLRFDVMSGNLEDQDECTQSSGSGHRRQVADEHGRQNRRRQQPSGGDHSERDVAAIDAQVEWGTIRSAGSRASKAQHGGERQDEGADDDGHGDLMGCIRLLRGRRVGRMPPMITRHNPVQLHNPPRLPSRHSRRGRASRVPCGAVPARRVRCAGRRGRYRPAD